MKKKKMINIKSIIALMMIYLLLISTGCTKKQEASNLSGGDIFVEQDIQKTTLTPDTIQLNSSSQDFSNIPLSVLNDSQIGSIADSTIIDDIVTYGEYIPKEFNEDNPEGYTYSYIEVSGIQYALSHSLGENRYELTKTTLADANTVYIINELRGASYSATIFIMIKNEEPYIISEIDGFAQVDDIDKNNTKEVVSNVGTVPETSIYFFDFDKQIVNSVNINEQSGAKYSMYDNITNTFNLAFEPNQDPVTYNYEANELIRK